MRTIIALSLVLLAGCSSAPTAPPVQYHQEVYDLPTTDPGVWDTYTISCESGTPVNSGCNVSEAEADLHVNEMINTGWYCSVSPHQVQGVTLTIWVNCSEPGDP